MSRVAYVQGRYVPHQEATTHIDDRGYQFADGVYEVVAIHRGRLVDEQGHLDRLNRSLGELCIGWPMPPSALKVVMREVIRRNRIHNGIIYLQITRGIAPRNHAFPKTPESVTVMTARSTAPFDPDVKGVSVITIPEIRWTRRDIKTISLLPNVLGKQQAEEEGAYEAWMVEENGQITEGTSSNAWIVTVDGELVTRQASHAILNGITRLAVIRLATEEGIELVERPFSVDEARKAREAFVTSTTSFVKPVVRLDGDPVGDGEPGPLTRRLIEYYAAYLDDQDAA